MVPQEVGSFGDHVLEVGEGELSVSVEVGLLDGFITYQPDLLGRQLSFGQFVQSLLQIVLTDEVVPVIVCNRAGKVMSLPFTLHYHCEYYNRKNTWTVSEITHSFLTPLSLHSEYNIVHYILSSTAERKTDFQTLLRRR